MSNLLKFYFIFLLIFIPIFTNASITSKITGTNKKLKLTNKLYKINHQQFKALEKKILKQRASLRKINKNLKNLKRWLSSKESTLVSKNKNLGILTKKRDAILKDVEKIQQDFINHISKNLSLLLVLNDKDIYNEEDIIEEFMFRRYTKFIDKHIQSLLSRLKKRRRDVSMNEKKLASINKYIKNINTRTKKTNILKQKRLKSIKSLDKKLAVYRSKINRINTNKNYLSSLLRKLKIQNKKTKKKKTRRIKTKQVATATYSDDLDIDIRQVHSSYKREKVLRYRGRRTIPPIKKYKLISKFGNSFDKIYNIKTFNSSVILKSKIKNQKVHTVLNGKVIFADKTPTLDKTIIIQHPNGIHTVYANLSVIAPQIRQGRSLKKGYVIGRVSDELIFEVVKKNYYINPMEFIALR